MAGRHYKSPESVTDWLHQRQTRGVSVSQRFSKHCCMTPVMVQRLGLFTQLESHTGCVNCLQVITLFVSQRIYLNYYSVEQVWQHVGQW